MNIDDWNKVRHETRPETRGGGGGEEGAEWVRNRGEVKKAGEHRTGKRRTRGEIKNEDVPSSSSSQWTNTDLRLKEREEKNTNILGGGGGENKGWVHRRSGSGPKYAY